MPYGIGGMLTPGIIGIEGAEGIEGNEGIGGDVEFWPVKPEIADARSHSSSDARNAAAMYCACHACFIAAIAAA